MWGEYRIAQDSVAGRRRLEEAMEERRGAEEGVSGYRAIRRGWFLGEEALKKELLAQMGKGFGAHHGGEERQESAEQQAEGLDKGRTGPIGVGRSGVEAPAQRRAA